MSFILGLLGACLGIILAVAIIIGIILISLNKHLGAGSLKQILHAARNAKDIRNQEYSRIKNPQVLEQIQDMKSRSIWAKYDGIVFHTHAIKNYEKNNGMATITTSSTIEYYYDTNLEKEKYSDVKKQTRYTCKFVYIYDENKMETNNNVFVIRCPNCGAPLRSLKINECEREISDLEYNLKYEDEYENEDSSY